MYANSIITRGSPRVCPMTSPYQGYVLVNVLNMQTDGRDCCRIRHSVLEQPVPYISQGTHRYVSSQVVQSLQ